MQNTTSESDRHLRQRLSNYAPWGVVHLSSDFVVTGVNRWVLDNYTLTETQILDLPVGSLFVSSVFDIRQLLIQVIPTNDFVTKPVEFTIGRTQKTFELLIRKSSDTSTYSITFAEYAAKATEQSLIAALQNFIADMSKHQSLEDVNSSLQDHFRPLNIGFFCALTQEPHSVSRQLKETRDVEPFDFLGVWVFGRKIPLSMIADAHTVSRFFGVTHVDTVMINTREFFESLFDPNTSCILAQRFSMAGLNRILTITLNSGEHKIGILSLMGPFVDHETLRHLHTYAHFIQGIFSQLHQRLVLETQVIRLQKLNSHISRLSEVTHLDGLFAYIANATSDIFDASHTFVLHRDIADDTATIVASVGAITPPTLNYAWNMLSNHADRDDTLATTSDPFLNYIKDKQPITVAITLPLSHNGRCFAVVYIANIHAELLSQSDIIYAQQFGEYVAAYHARLLLTESLDRSEKRYRFLLNESSNPVFVVNQYDQILHMNHAGRQMVGIDDEVEILLSDVLTHESALTWNDERARLLGRLVDKLFWKGEVLNVIRHTKTPFEAEVICVQHSAVHIEFLITIHDITDRIKAEQQHRLRENELDLFQHITSVVNSSLNLDELLERSLDIFEEVNFGSMYGILLLDEQQTPYLAAHRHVPELLMERLLHDPITLRGGMDLVLSGTEQSDYTNVVPVKSIVKNEIIAELGNLIGAKISVDDKTIGAILSSRPFLTAPDFTPRDMQILHAIANQLARSITNARLHHSLQQAADRNSMLYTDAEKIRTHLSSVIESSPDALVLLQRDTWSMRVLNEDPFVAWGYVHGSLQQKPLQTICSPEQIPVMNEHLVRIRNQPSYSFECMLLRANGTDFTALISANMVNADEVLLSIRDITPMRLLENRIKQREKLALLGQMIATVAHELNNPIAVIRGIAQLQLMQAHSPDIQHDLEVIERTSQRAGRIVQQLRMLGQPQKIAFVEVDLKELIEHIVMQSRIGLEQANIEYRFMDTACTDARVFGDTAQLEQVLVNLIDNAIRAMQDVEGPRLLIFKLQASAHDIELIVEDTGLGVDADARTRLFEPFFSTRQVGEGMGLGLAIVQTIVTQHHGAIHHENRLSGGSRFVITLPMLSAPRLTIAKQTVASETYLTIIELLHEILRIPIIEVDSPRVPADMLVIDAALLNSYPSEVLAHRMLCIISPRDVMVPIYADATVVVCTDQMDATLIRQQLQTLVAELIIV